MLLCSSLPLSSAEGALTAARNVTSAHTGYLIRLGDKGAPIKWGSHEQALVSHSSAESELYALDAAIMPLMAIVNLARELGQLHRPGTIYQDNQSTIILSERGYAASSKTKHIAIRFFYVKERIEADDIRIEKCHTSTMVADIFTKPLTGALYRSIRTLLKNSPSTVPPPLDT